MQGWVSIHRKIMNNPVWQDPKLLKLWMLCLLEASHKEHEQLVGKQVIKLEPGQFVTGRFSLADSYNNGMKKSDQVNDRTLWRWIKTLEEFKFLTIKSTPKYSVISINNWNVYQQNVQVMSNGIEGFSNNEQNNDQQNDQQKVLKNLNKPMDSNEHAKKMTYKMTNNCPANVQQVSTNNNGNKGNNENKKETTTTTENPIALFEKSLCRLSPFQADSLLKWVDDFGGKSEIVNEAITIADNKNKRYFGFVEFLLKEWANNKLDSLDRIRVFEQEKFNKAKKSNGSFNRKPIRQEKLPDWFDEEAYSKQTSKNPITEDEAEAKRKEIEERLKQLRSS